MICPGCGGKIEDDNFGACPKCGFDLEVTEDPAPEARIVGDLLGDFEEPSLIEADGVLFYTASKSLSPRAIPKLTGVDVTIPNTKIEQQTLALIDGRLNVAEVQQRAGLTFDEVTVALLNLRDKGVVRLEMPGFALPADDEFADSVHTERTDAPWIDPPTLTPDVQQPVLGQQVVDTADLDTPPLVRPAFDTEDLVVADPVAPQVETIDPAPPRLPAAKLPGLTPRKTKPTTDSGLAATAAARSPVPKSPTPPPLPVAAKAPVPKAPTPPPMPAAAVKSPVPKAPTSPPMPAAKKSPPPLPPPDDTMPPYADDPFNVAEPSIAEDASQLVVDDALTHSAQAFSDDSVTHSAQAFTDDLVTYSADAFTDASATHSGRSFADDELTESPRAHALPSFADSEAARPAIIDDAVATMRPSLADSEAARAAIRPAIASDVPVADENFMPGPTTLPPDALLPLPPDALTPLDAEVIDLTAKAPPQPENKPAANRSSTSLPATKLPAATKPSPVASKPSGSPLNPPATPPPPRANPPLPPRPAAQEISARAPTSSSANPTLAARTPVQETSPRGPASASANPTLAARTPVQETSPRGPTSASANPTLPTRPPVQETGLRAPTSGSANPTLAARSPAQEAGGRDPARAASITRPPAAAADAGKEAAARARSVANARVSPKPGETDIELRARRLYEQAMLEKESGDVLSALNNMKLAFTFCPTNDQYKRALLELQASGAVEAGKRPAGTGKARALYEQATQAERLGDIDKAQDLLEKALEISKEAMIYNRLGVILAMRRKDYERGRELIEKALELAPKNDTYQHNLAKVLARAAASEVDHKSKEPKKGGLLGFLKKS